MDFTEFVGNILIVMAVFFLIIFPLAAAYLVTIFDIVFRVDMGIGKLLWAGAVMAIPGLGLLMYWLVRPKGFNPLIDKEDLGIGSAPRLSYATVSPALQLVPREPPAEDEESQRRAA